MFDDYELFFELLVILDFLNFSFNKIKHRAKVSVTILTHLNQNIFTLLF